VRRLADLDAVTFDANGTLVRLVDPVPELERVLREHGIERPPSAIRRAFEAEGRVYAGRAVEAHQPTAFATVQRECTGIFLDELGAETLDAAEFVPSYVGAMRFELLPDVRESLERLKRCGLELAVVANFDLTLRARLEELGIGTAFSAIVTPAEAGVAKPAAEIFQHALELLAVAPERALHIGDGAADEEGAAAAGMNFTWTPISQALQSWT
jgi:HAD superfamily hydrolase (TIGR01509 family)